LIRFFYSLYLIFLISFNICWQKGVSPPNTHQVCVFFSRFGAVFLQFYKVQNCVFICIFLVAD